MKKNFLMGLSALVLLGTVAGCVRPQPSTSSQGGTPNTSSAAPTTSAANPLAGTYDATVWVSEITGVKELTEQQIDAFEAANPGIVINATVQKQTEADAATAMITDVSLGADIYCFAQDQLARLVQANALTKLGQQAKADVTAANDGGSVASATVDGEMYCYPLTSDNGYFMYYDKNVVKESSLGSLEAILADCKAAGRNFSFELEGSAWYNASFFFATGCESTWTMDDEGEFVSVTDTFNSPEGLVALKGMQKVLTSEQYVNSSKVQDFVAATPSAVVVSGTWASATVSKIFANDDSQDNIEIPGADEGTTVDPSTIKKGQLGELGVAKLPSFTVDGKSYQLGSFCGCKLMGVKPQVDAKKAAVLQKLAVWLTNEQCQLERFEQFGWGPSNKNAQANEKVKADKALSALATQNQYATPQGQIHGSWWDIAKVYASSAKVATSDVELEAALETYEAAIKGLFSMSEEVKNAFTVIGGINGSMWDKDFSMEEVEKDVWVTKDSFTLAAGEQFKVRQGLSWSCAFGTWDASKALSDQPNYVVATAGTYKIKLTVVRDSSGAIVSGTIELVAA